jgi:hypothetical protein
LGLRQFLETLLRARLGLGKLLDGCFEAIEALFGARLGLRELGYRLSEPIEILTGDPNLFDSVVYYSNNGAIELRRDPWGSAIV